MPKLPDNEMLKTKHNRKHALDHKDTNRREAAHGSPYRVQQEDPWLYPCPRKFHTVLQKYQRYQRWGLHGGEL